MRDSFDAFKSLECLQKDPPSATLTTTARSNHHQTVVYLCDLVELKYLQKHTSLVALTYFFCMQWYYLIEN